MLVIRFGGPGNKGKIAMKPAYVWFKIVGIFEYGQCCSLFYYYVT